MSKYTSKDHINRYLKKNNLEKSHQNEKVILRSQSDKFTFKQCCIICGESCLEKDRKHPDRWRKFQLCGVAENSLKESLLRVCESRGDAQSCEVRLRLMSTVSDLKAVGARYHKDCHVKFVRKGNLSGSLNSLEIDPLQELIACMEKDCDRFWNSVEVMNQYKSFGGDIKDRRSIIRKLQTHFQGDLLVLSSPGNLMYIAIFSTSSLNNRCFKYPRVQKICI